MPHYDMSEILVLPKGPGALDFMKQFGASETPNVAKHFSRTYGGDEERIKNIGVQLVG